MPSVPESLDEARARIARAYDPALLGAAGHRLADLFESHLRAVTQSKLPVLPWAHPEENIQKAERELRTGDASDLLSNSALAERFSQLVELMLSRGINLHDPRYVGHQVPAPVPLAGLFDAVGAVTNQPMAIYEMGPFGTAVEQAVLRELGQCVGWPAGQFAGVLTHGASIANLTALLVARNVTFGESWEMGLPRSGPPPVLISQADAHYCIARSAGILGLGTSQVIKAPLDDRRRMCPARLREILADLRRREQPILAVVACACATPIGAFDPLVEIAELCREFEVWLHVDAAHGGAALLSQRHRHLVAGLDRADSFTWDAHKMLFVPALCAFLFFRQKQHSFDAFRQHAPYLFDPSAPDLADYDSGLRTLECTKRAAAFGLWGVWSLFGRQLFADLVDVTFDLGQQFHAKLTAAPDFQTLHEPQCNIVVFRHVPPALRDAPPDRLGRFQLDLRRAVIESGRFYLVPAFSNGTAALRVTLINPLTTPQHLDALLDELRDTGARLLRDG